MENDKDIDAVWEKAQKVQGWDSSRWRKDECGAPIGKKEYGDRNSKYGWEVHHIDANPKNDKLDNKIPLHWENNAARGNTPNSKKCEKTN